MHLCNKNAKLTKFIRDPFSIPERISYVNKSRDEQDYFSLGKKSDNLSYGNSPIKLCFSKGVQISGKNFLTAEDFVTIRIIAELLKYKRTGSQGMDNICCSSREQILGEDTENPPIPQ